jgi:hypothetical protein
VLVPCAAEWDGAAWVPLNSVVPQLVQFSGDADTLVVQFDDTYPQYISSQVTAVRAAGAENFLSIVFSPTARTLTIELTAGVALGDQINVLAIFSEQLVA